MAFLSDPADGSLYVLGTQKQQGLMVCFPSLLGMGPGRNPSAREPMGERTVCQSGVSFEAVRQGSEHCKNAVCRVASLAVSTE
jgi:hypothetical protein